MAQFTYATLTTAILNFTETDTSVLSSTITDQLIGNGSKVNASYYPKAYTQYGGGVKGYLQGVQVVNLVKYNNDDFQVVSEGYDSSNNSNDIPFEP